MQLGTLKLQARFIVVQGLAADCILGCQFIDRQVQAVVQWRARFSLECLVYWELVNLIVSNRGIHTS
jgi:hypothetical protein